jgi:hypothetical protein
MINHKWVCILCGQNYGLKMKCDHTGCFCKIGGVDEKVVMHVTCARQAGLEVQVDDQRMNKKGGPLCYGMFFVWIKAELYSTGTSNFYLLLHSTVRCYRHSGNAFNLRAKLEDLIEIEKKRAGKDYSKADAPMKLSDASRLLYASIHVMRTLGWAWRWAEWWVDYNSSWEPLLEPWQDERKMTKEELKIVESTRERRCEDARKCRLAAFGAALRNRMYDLDDGFKERELDRALRAVLHTASLVGPLSTVEIDFYVDWLSRAYRSKSRLLYFGEYKGNVSPFNEFCIHADKTPKFELGERPLPGEQNLRDGDIFESNIQEVDSFLQSDLLSGSPAAPKSRKSSEITKTPRNRKCESTYENGSALVSSPLSSSRPGNKRSKIWSDHTSVSPSLNNADDTQILNSTAATTSLSNSSKIKLTPIGKRRARPPRSQKEEEDFALNNPSDMEMPVDIDLDGAINVARIHDDSHAVSEDVVRTLPIVEPENSAVFTPIDDVKAYKVDDNIEHTATISTNTNNNDLSEMPVNELEVAHEAVDLEAALDRRTNEKYAGLETVVESNVDIKLSTDGSETVEPRPAYSRHSEQKSAVTQGCEETATKDSISSSTAASLPSNLRERRQRDSKMISGSDKEGRLVNSTFGTQGKKVSSQTKPTVVEKYDVLKRRSRQPTSLFTYEHKMKKPPKSATQRSSRVRARRDPDDDLPLSVLVARAQSALELSRIFDERQEVPMVDQSITPPDPSTVPDAMGSPQQRGRQRGQQIAAAAASNRTNELDLVDAESPQQLGRQRGKKDAAKFL